jgi:hypothetical protein
MLTAPIEQTITKLRNKQTNWQTSLAWLQIQRQTNEQTNKQVNKQTNKQTRKQTSKPTRTNKHSLQVKQTNKQNCTIAIETSKHANKQTKHTTKSINQTNTQSNETSKHTKTRHTFKRVSKLMTLRSLSNTKANETQNHSNKQAHPHILRTLATDDDVEENPRGKQRNSTAQGTPTLKHTYSTPQQTSTQTTSLRQSLTSGPSPRKVRRAAA